MKHRQVWEINLLTYMGCDPDGDPTYDVGLEEFYGTQEEVEARCKELQSRYDYVSFAFEI